MAAIVIRGYRQLLRDLDAIQPGLRKETMKEINRAAGEVRTLARGYLPEDPGMSGWDRANYSPGSRWYVRGYNAREARAGIQVKRGQSRPNGTGYKNEIAIENRSAAGMIYELAGSKSDGRDARGARFIDNIAATGLRKPLRRVVLRAVVERGPHAADRIKAVLRITEARFNARQRTVR